MFSNILLQTKHLRQRLRSFCEAKVKTVLYQRKEIIEMYGNDIYPYKWLLFTGNVQCLAGITHNLVLYNTNTPRQLLGAQRQRRLMNMMLTSSVGIWQRVDGESMAGPPYGTVCDWYRGGCIGSQRLPIIFRARFTLLENDDSPCFASISYHYKSIPSKRSNVSGGALWGCRGPNIDVLDRAAQ